MFIVFLSWIGIGLLTGFIASKLVNLRGDDPIVGIACATVGAVAAGILYAVLSGQGVSTWNLWSMGAAVMGGVAGAAIYHLVRSRSIGREQQSVRRSY